MKDKRYGLFRRITGPVIVLALLALAVGNLQAIGDYVRLYNYQPPAEIAAFADETTMTDEARKLYYVNHPKLADKQSFNDKCRSRGEKTIVLGCYHSVNRGIYLFDVKDERLKGVEQVTAAHEMLHAAYDRLSSKERKSIDTQLQDFYDTQVQDKRIRDTVAAYEQSEPNDLTNEMHSIFATEIAQLTPALESHYKRYFNDRSKLVELAGTYQMEFISRQDQVRAMDARLKGLKEEIDENSAELKRREAEISALQRQIEDDRQSGNIESYNARVPVYNGMVDRYNELIRSTQNSIAEYNRLVALRNDLALEVRELTRSIDSQLETIE